MEMNNYIRSPHVTDRVGSGIRVHEVGVVDISVIDCITSNLNNLQTVTNQINSNANLNLSRLC